MFKKEAATEEKKTRGKNNQSQEKNTEVRLENRVEQAFSKILAWGHLPSDIESNSLLIKPA